jgi:hypothetical protein
VSSEIEIAVHHEASHVAVAAFFNVPTIEVSITPDGHGVAKLCRNVRHLDPYSCSLISLSGPVSETKFSGAELTVPVAHIWDAMWSLCRFQKPPRSDTANIARTLIATTSPTRRRYA